MKRTKLLSAGLVVCSVAVLTAGCAGGPSAPPTVGHISDGVYVLYPEEQSYSCEEFDGATRYAVRQAFERVGDGNRAAVMTMVGNLMALGMGGIPRGINFGATERFEGRQEMTKALTLDNAARAKGCPGVDIAALVDEELGSGSLEKVVAERSGNLVDPILSEETELKARIR